jgi:hypothetical protein
MVRFEANVPIEIALQCVDGVRVAGRYGDRVKYTLTDERTMYVAPFVAERIKELEIQPGEVFQVCKLQAKKGNSRTIHWAVERGGEEETQLERDLRGSLARLNNPDIASMPLIPPAIAAPEAHVPPPSPFHELEHSAPDGIIRNGHGRENGSGKTATNSPPSIDNPVAGPPDTQLAHARERPFSKPTIDALQPSPLRFLAALRTEVGR